MSLLNFGDDSINDALMAGLKDKLSEELKRPLMVVAEKEVDIVVDSVCRRMQVIISERSGDGPINLEWLLRKDK